MTPWYHLKLPVSILRTSIFRDTSSQVTGPCVPGSLGPGIMVSWCPGVQDPGVPGSPVIPGSRIHENHMKIMKNQIFQKSSGIIPDASGSLQNISNDSLASPKASWVKFTNIVFFLIFHDVPKGVGVERVALIHEIWGYHRNQRQKSWEYLSRMIGIMDLTRSYHWSKGSLVTIVEDAALGNLAAAGDREETASHQFIPIETCMQSFITIIQTATEHEPVKGRLRPDLQPAVNRQPMFPLR